VAGWPVEQKPAKRPDAKEGGREEEEKRLGIATDPQGAGRLRSAKNGVPDTAVAGEVVGVVSPVPAGKFRVVVIMCPPEGADGLKEIKLIGLIVTV
jgi:hypothetical protein